MLGVCMQIQPEEEHDAIVWDFHLQTSKHIRMFPTILFTTIVSPLVFG